MKTSLILYILSSFVQVASSTFCVWYPLWKLGGTLKLHKFNRILLANSNQDIWVLSIINTIALIIFLRIDATSKTAHGSSFRRLQGNHRHALAVNGAYFTCLLFQLLLLAKAVIVAILSDGYPFPDPKNKDKPGLLYVYTSLCMCLITSFIQSPSIQAIMTSWEKKRQSSPYSPGMLTQPLLTGIATSDDQQHTHNLDNNDMQKNNDVGDADEGKKHRPDTTHTTILALLRLSVPDAPILFLAFSAGAMAALGQALIPYYTGRIIDYASIDPNRDAFKQTTIRLLVVAFVCSLFTGVRGGLFTLSMTRLNVRLRTQLFHSLLTQDVGFFDSTKTGEITSRLSADTSTVSDQISLNLNIMLRSTTQAIMVLFFMFSASWRLTVVTFVMIPVVLVICKVYGSYYRKLSKKVQSELAAANSVAEEALSSISTVRAHAAEGSVKAAYSSRLAKFYSILQREAAAYSIYITTNTFLSAAVIAGVLYYGGTLVLDHAMSAGALVSFMLYQQSLSAAFQQLGDVFSALSAAVGAADKVIELMMRSPAFRNDGTVTAPMFAGHIELRDVSFCYPSRPLAPILSSFNLLIQPGEVVALVGPSGGGKSSIVRLLERFYIPTSGSILLDNRDISTYDHGWLRRHMALVSQEPVLYARSIRRNIIFGLEEDDNVPANEIPTMQDIEDAARLANAHDFISQLPDGYETECGERGVQLSGGQKQRIAIARALVRRPAVLLLDEATSALDADSEAVVQEALDHVMRGRTVLVIAHRLSTVQNASRIVVVKDGNVVETGSHEELISRGGAYALLVKRQMTRSVSSASVGGLLMSSSSQNLVFNG